MPQNPYIAGKVIKAPNDFVGRERDLRRIKDILRRNQALLIYGGRRTGKTSVLLRLKDEWSKNSRYIPIYFDLQHRARWDLNRILEELTQEIVEATDQSQPVKEISAGYLLETWLPEICSGVRQPIVLLFDELDVLATPGNELADFFEFINKAILAEHRNLRFVFVIGKHWKNLSRAATLLSEVVKKYTLPLSGSLAIREIIRKADDNGTLQFPLPEIERIERLTGGHPYFTQALCSQIWEIAHNRCEENTPKVTEEDIEKALASVLSSDSSILGHMWDKLNEIQKIFTSILSEYKAGLGKSDLVSELTSMHQSPSVGEIDNAIEVLQEKQLIIENGDKYQVSIELFRCWIEKYCPLPRVIEQLDSPDSKDYYNLAIKEHKLSTESAIQNLKKAIQSDPYHQDSYHLLANLYLDQNNVQKAVEALENLYAQVCNSDNRSRLISLLMHWANKAQNYDIQVQAYERVLELNPVHEEAQNALRGIWEERGDIAWEEGSLNEALNCYREANSEEKTQKVRAKQLERESNRLNQFDKGEIEDCQDALEFIRKLQKEFNDIEYNWEELAQPFEKQLELDHLYKDGLKYIKENNRDAAIDALAQIMAIDPGYKDAIDYLYSAITGNSIEDWQREIQSKCQEIEGLKQRIQLRDKRIYQLEHPQQLEPQKDFMVLEKPVEIQIPSNLEQVSYSTGGNRLAIACSSGGYIIDANSFSPIPVPGLSEKVNCVAFDAEDNIIFGSTQGDLIVCKSNENQYDFLSLQAHESQITSIAVSPDRKLIGSGSFDQKVKLWTQYENGYRSVGPVIEHNGWARSVKFSPDSTLLASGSEDGTVHLVDLESYELLQILECGVEAVLDIAFSPQGGVLAVTGASGNIEFWRIRDGQLLDSLIAHESWVRCIGYSEKGKELFSCSSDSTLVVWDAKEKTEIQRLEKHESQVMSFAISPTGEQLATIEWEGVALLWKIAG